MAKFALDPNAVGVIPKLTVENDPRCADVSDDFGGIGHRDGAVRENVAAHLAVDGEVFDLDIGVDDSELGPDSFRTVAAIKAYVDSARETAHAE